MSSVVESDKDCEEALEINGCPFQWLEDVEIEYYQSIL